MSFISRSIPRHARIALEVLVDCAEKRQVITYGELSKEISAPANTVIPRVLGFIRDEICRPYCLPPINVIVVSKDTQLPGEYFLPGGTSNLTDDEYRRIFEGLRDQVFACPNWSDLLYKLGIREEG